MRLENLAFLEAVKNKIQNPITLARAKPPTTNSKFSHGFDEARLHLTLLVLVVLVVLVFVRRREARDAEVEEEERRSDERRIALVPSHGD